MLTDFLENKFLDVLFSRAGWSGKPTSLYFAIFTTTPVDAGTGGVEVSGNGYARKAVAVDGAQWTVDNGQATNVNVISWSPATAAWGEAKSLGIYTAATGGTLLAILELPSPIQIDQYNQFQVSAGGIILQSSGVLTDYAREALLAYWLNGTAMPSIPTFWAGLGTGSEATRLGGEPATTWGYERKSIANSSGNWPAASSGNKKINADSPHAFLTNGTNAWPTVSHVGLFDSFGFQKISTVAATNLITIAAGATSNQFQNGDKVVLVRNDLGTGRIDTSSPALYPNRVHFVVGRGTGTFRVAAEPSGTTIVIHAAGALTLSASTNAFNAFLADAANIQVTVPNDGSANINATAHGLVVGDMVVLAPRDYTDYNTASPPVYSGTTVYPTGLTSVTSPDGAQNLYFVVAATADTFQLALTAGGAALIPTATGTAVDVCRLNMGRLIISGQMTNPLTIASGDTAQISDEALNIDMD